MDRNARAKWKEHVNNQLELGGGSLFKYVSMREKQHLSVGISGGTECDPSRFICDEHGRWSALWYPEDTTPGDVHELIGELNKINELAKSGAEFDHVSMDFHTFKKVLKTYHKDSKGADNWTATELAKLPDLILNIF